MTDIAEIKLTKDEALVAYICNKLSNDPYFGSIKLNKVLHACDGVSFLKDGKPISSFKYVKQGKGPTPEPLKFLTIRDNLVQRGVLHKKNVERFGFIQKRYECEIDIDVSAFTSQEIETINSVIIDLSNLNATELSEKSHSPSWTAAKFKEEMPIFTYMSVSEDPTMDEISFALRSIGI